MTYKTYKVRFSYDYEVEVKEGEDPLEKAREGFSDGLCYSDIRASEFDASSPVFIDSYEDDDEEDEEEDD